jgi:hypothetical protein
MLAVEGESLVITTFAGLLHPFLVTVHVNVFAPEPKPVMPDVFKVGVVILPEPPDKVHKPVPGDGSSPTIV